MEADDVTRRLSRGTEEARAVQNYERRVRFLRAVGTTRSFMELITAEFRNTKINYNRYTLAENSSFFPLSVLLYFSLHL